MLLHARGVYLQYLGEGDGFPIGVGNVRGSRQVLTGVGGGDVRRRRTLHKPNLKVSTVGQS